MLMLNICSVNVLFQDGSVDFRHNIISLIIRFSADHSF